MPLVIKSTSSTTGLPTTYYRVTGFGEPQAAIIIFKATAGDTLADVARVSYGFWINDNGGVNDTQGSISAYSDHGVATSVAKTGISQTHGFSFWHPTGPTFYHAGKVKADPNGIQVDWDFRPTSGIGVAIEVILIKGASAVQLNEFRHGGFSGDGKELFTPGCKPHFNFFIQADEEQLGQSGEKADADISIGWAHYNGTTTEQACQAYSDRDNLATTQCARWARNDGCMAFLEGTNPQDWGKFTYISDTQFEIDVHFNPTAQVFFCLTLELDDPTEIVSGSSLGVHFGRERTALFPYNFTPTDFDNQVDFFQALYLAHSSNLVTDTEEAWRQTYPDLGTDLNNCIGPTLGSSDSSGDASAENFGQCAINNSSTQYGSCGNGNAAMGTAVATLSTGTQQQGAVHHRNDGYDGASVGFEVTATRSMDIGLPFCWWGVKVEGPARKNIRRGFTGVPVTNANIVDETGSTFTAVSKINGTPGPKTDVTTATYARGDFANGTNTIELDIENMPADFVAMESAQVNARTEFVGWINDPSFIGFRLITSGGTALSEWSYDPRTSLTDSEFSHGNCIQELPDIMPLFGAALKLNATGLAATPATWNAARLEIIWEHDRTQGADGHETRIYELDLQFSYESTPSYNEHFLASGVTGAVLTDTYLAGNNYAETFSAAGVTDTVLTEAWALNYPETFAASGVTDAVLTEAWALNYPETFAASGVTDAIITEAWALNYVETFDATGATDAVLSEVYQSPYLETFAASAISDAVLTESWALDYAETFAASGVTDAVLTETWALDYAETFAAAAVADLVLTDAWALDYAETLAAAGATDAILTEAWALDYAETFSALAVSDAVLNEAYAVEFLETFAASAVSDAVLTETYAADYLETFAASAVSDAVLTETWSAGYAETFSASAVTGATLTEAWALDYPETLAASGVAALTLADAWALDYAETLAASAVAALTLADAWALDYPETVAASATAAAELAHAFGYAEHLSATATTGAELTDVYDSPVTDYVETFAASAVADAALTDVWALDYPETFAAAGATDCALVELWELSYTETLAAGAVAAATLTDAWTLDYPETVTVSAVGEVTLTDVWALDYPEAFAAAALAGVEMAHSYQFGANYFETFAANSNAGLELTHAFTYQYAETLSAAGITGAILSEVWALDYPETFNAAAVSGATLSDVYEQPVPGDFFETFDAAAIAELNLTHAFYTPAVLPTIINASLIAQCAAGRTLGVNSGGSASGADRKLSTSKLIN